MGESGAGKTTLLNVLAQRVTMGVVTGDMLVNGKALPVSFQRQTGAPLPSVSPIPPLIRDHCRLLPEIGRAHV